MDILKRNIKLAYDAISEIRVSGNDVENMAIAREALRNAWNELKNVQDSEHTESGGGKDGG